ncbi:glycerol-3-phosphate dehydrogenase (NAD(P)+) [Bhargavaea ginsengi]|uniref:Glycerol-3-phosphate dehydrogenase [NAD(P)+] n=1 Tax=Bhargavaea ginsengi TaxID=426757 RepID=A0A1H6SFC5_9BACL|nr:NAD(P)H-dependent glycerol-3-phosphate dehydrogenase [Bhargavaea ginsengi]SEI65576.1 glycerol-3-phosphate dehydrogenase (NAD(P)+) [Bhargavaea ginsengi]
MTKVAVLGAGSWGTALAAVLASNGHDCTLWSRRTEQAEEIAEKHTNEQYLPGAVLPDTLKADHNLARAVSGASIIVMAVPTKGIRKVCRDLNSVLEGPVLFAHVSKGIEPDTHKRISEVMEEELDREICQGIVVLSGPSHAEEVIRNQPTTVTVAAKNTEHARRVQDLFMNQSFRVYTNDDVVGVEIGGALKNIIALAAGVTDGLGYGDNAKAALITRGLAEITRLGVAMGANPLTFSGLSGLGDLIVTCTSVHSRNWRAGNMLGKGKSLDEVLDSMGMVVEGVRTTKAAHQLSKECGVPMPITEALYAVLFEGQKPIDRVELLMGRMKKNETEDLAGWS